MNLAFSLLAPCHIGNGTDAIFERVNKQAFSLVFRLAIFSF
jgi:hypothetical protein